MRFILLGTTSLTLVLLAPIPALSATGDRDTSQTTGPSQAATPDDETTAGQADNSTDPDSTVEPPTSDDSSADTSDRFSLEHRRDLYRQSRLSPWAAAGWTMLLPGLGNLYAEQYLLAGLGFVSVTFSGSFLAYGYAVDNLALRALGFSFAGIAYGGGLGTSIAGVHRYNRQRRQSLGLDDQRAHFRFGPDGPRHNAGLSEPFMLNLRFSF